MFTSFSEILRSLVVNPSYAFKTEGYKLATTSAKNTVIGSSLNPPRKGLYKKATFTWSLVSNDATFDLLLNDKAVVRLEHSWDFAFKISLLKKADVDESFEALDNLFQDIWNKPYDVLSSLAVSPLFVLTVHASRYLDIQNIQELSKTKSVNSLKPEVWHDCYDFLQGMCGKSWYPEALKSELPIKTSVKNVAEVAEILCLPPSKTELVTENSVVDDVYNYPKNKS